MHVVVVTKSTPDDNARISVDGSGKVVWGEKLVMNPWDEYAVTEAILLKEAHNARVTILTLGDEEQNEALKSGLAIGCDEAIRIWDSSLENYDSQQYSKAIAAAIQKLEDVDLVIFGKEFVDVYNDQHVYQVARRLGWNLVGSILKITAIDAEAKTLQVERQVEQGKQLVSTRLPAVVSLFDDINEAKYPTFMGIRKASKATIPVWDAATLGVDLGQPATQVLEYSNLPQREGSVEWIEGESAAEKAQNLVKRLLEDKIL